MSTAMSNATSAPGMDNIELDEIDKAIIRELQVDGRMPYAQLAPIVGLSQAATRQRVNRLIDRGAMQVVAVTDPVRLGFGHQAWLGISVSADAALVAKAMADIASVDYVLLTGGRFDILAEVTCSGSDHLLSVVNEDVRSIEGISKIEIMSSLRLVKETYTFGTGPS